MSDPFSDNNKHGGSNRGGMGRAKTKEEGKWICANVECRKFRTERRWVAGAKMEGLVRPRDVVLGRVFLRIPAAADHQDLH